VGYEVTDKELAPQLALTYRTRATMPTIAERIGARFGALMEHAAQTGAQWAGPPFVMYPETCDDDYPVIVCMPVAPGAVGGETVTLEEVAGGRVASTTHVGSYKGIGAAYTALQKWMTDNGCAPGGAPREIYLNDPATVPEDELITEVDWPVS